MIERLVTDLAGSRELIIPFALLALAGLLAASLADDWRPLNPAAIALPWLVVPPFVLIAVSFIKPVYYVRYVEFCLPALAILVGAGLVGLIRLAAATPLGRLRLTWLPAVVVIAGLAALLAGPQQAIRQTAARPDNLRRPPPSWRPTSNLATRSSISRPTCGSSAPGTRHPSCGSATWPGPDPRSPRPPWPAPRSPAPRC